MTGLLNFLTRTPVLIGFFVATMVIGFSFSLVTPQLNGAMLDMQMSAGKARTYLEGLSADQRATHFWTTVLLDTAYPVAYGGFFAGMAARLAGRWRGWAALPAGVTVLVDMAENTAQAVALKGGEGWLAAKDALTPLKFGFFIFAAVLALALALFALGRWLLNRTRG